MTDELTITTLATKNGAIGHILLNRPKALNALSLNMLQGLKRQFSEWETDTNIHAILLTSNSERAFCAGGDIRAVYEFHHQHPHKDTPFFEIEYALNQIIFHHKKPVISYLDGITMGGGVGISIPGSHPIASENCCFAMPETAIGFFPDVGAGYFLNQCPSKTGWYLGLTGNSIKADDAYELGLVKHIIPQNTFTIFLEQLCQQDLSQDAHTAVTTLANQYHKAPTSSALLDNAELISQCFSQASVEDIIHALETQSHDWCQQQAEILKQRSPTSLKVTFELLQRCQSLSFNDVMTVNLTLSHHFVQRHDFMEGIRAAVIDKDKNPYWQPESLAEVTPELVEKYFH